MSWDGYRVNRYSEIVKSEFGVEVDEAKAQAILNKMLEKERLWYFTSIEEFEEYLKAAVQKTVGEEAVIFDEVKQFISRDENDEPIIDEYVLRPLTVYIIDDEVVAIPNYYNLCINDYL